MLKLSTLKERWHKVEKMAEAIIADEEPFIKHGQNGGADLSELDKLYYNLAKRMKAFNDSKQAEKERDEVNSHYAQQHFQCALAGVACSCRYNSVAQAEDMLREDTAGVEVEGSSCLPSLNRAAHNHRSPLLCLAQTRQN